MAFRAGYTDFRTLCAILSMTFLLAYGAMLAYGTGARAEPEGAVPPDAAQAQSESGSGEGHGTSPVVGGQTEAQGAGTEVAPEAAQTEAQGAGTEAAPEAAQTEAAPADSDPADEDAAAGTEEKPAEDAAAATEATPEEPASKVLITVDKEAQQMTVWVDGVEQHSWPVSTGMAGYSTPSGDYTASSMNEIWYSKQWDNAPMPNAIFFTKKGHAIHGSLDVKHLGKPASHGCVRISPTNAKTLYALVKEKGLKNTQDRAHRRHAWRRIQSGKPAEGLSIRRCPALVSAGTGLLQSSAETQGLVRVGRRWFQPDARQGYYQPPADITTAGY